MSNRTCKHCGDPALPSISFCKTCKAAILAELQAEGYLETGGYGRKGQNRTQDMKENTYETKHGTGHG